MKAVLIIPTGIGCEIGGHAGDANPVVKLVASVCDTLITHPNAVNASDINEMPENCLYVEGSILDRFLEGKIELKPVYSNKILLVVNRPVLNETINAVSAARATIGADISIVELKTPLKLIAKFDNDCATGDVFGWKELVTQVLDYDFDALAIATSIIVTKEVALDYFENGGVNPWGGVEAKASKLIATILNKPTAHSPIETNILRGYDELVDPRMAAEMVSLCYLHCILKGLHRAPRIAKGLSVNDISCLITPVGCVGRPHKACLIAGIPIIAVRENKTVLNDPMPDEIILVDNYMEAVGMMMAIKSGVNPASVRRPLKPTKILRIESDATFISPRC